VITKVDITPILGYLAAIALCIGFICVIVQYGDVIDNWQPTTIKETK